MYVINHGLAPFFKSMLNDILQKSNIHLICFDGSLIFSLTKDLNPTHLHQISVDGPNVDMKFFEEFSQHCKERSFHSLINIGSCGVRIVHGSFSRGETKSGWNLKIFLKKCLLCSSQFTSTQRRLRKCHWFQFIPFKFLLNKVILCLFS